MRRHFHLRHPFCESVVVDGATAQPLISGAALSKRPMTRWGKTAAGLATHPFHHLYFYLVVEPSNTRAPHFPITSRRVRICTPSVKQKTKQKQETVSSCKGRASRYSRQLEKATSSFQQRAITRSSSDAIRPSSI